MNHKEKTAQVLQDAANIVRAVSAERDELAEKLAAEQRKTASYERRVSAEKVAAMMHQKGINTDIDFPTLVADLEKAASEGKLDTIEEAVEMVGPDMGLKTASINHDAPAATGSDFERFLTGTVG
jgi:hypothetical protein